MMKEKFQILYKNPFRVFKCEHIKELCGIMQIDFLVKADWVDHFHSFVGATPKSTLPNTT